MAPRKTRAGTASSQTSDRPVRAGQKRRLESVSDANETSPVPEQETSSIASPTARKRQRQNSKPQQSRDKSKTTKEQEVETCVEQDNAASSTSHPPVKMPIKVRKTISPKNALNKRFKTARASLPTPEASTDAVELLQYTPLREIIDDRKALKRASLAVKDEEQLYWIDLARKEERARILAAHLQDADSFDEADVLQMQAELQELHLTLATVNKQKADQRVSDDLLIVDTRLFEDLSYTSATSPSSDSGVEHSVARQIDLSQHIQSATPWTAEREKLQDSVLILSQEVNETKERWRLHEIALQSLGFTSENATGDDIITAVRSTFDSLRNHLSAYFEDAGDALSGSNAELLQLIVQTLDDLFNSNTTLSRQVEDRSKLVAELRSQVKSLIERIADNENELERLTKQRTELLKHADNNDSTLDELQELIDTLTQKSATATTQLQQLTTQHEQAQQTVERYKKTLNHYRSEEERLQELVSRMEADHTAKVKKMNEEREKTIREMYEELDREHAEHTESREQLANAEGEVNRFKKELHTVTSGRDSVLEKLRTVDAELQAEQVLRQQAEAALQMRNTGADELEHRVDELELRLGKVQQTSTDLSARHKQESEQREAAEAKVAQLTAIIKEVKSRRDELGVEANKLRLKLHEIQQGHQAQVAHLEKELDSEQKQSHAAQTAANATRTHLEESLLVLRDTLASHKTTIVNLQQAMDETTAEHGRLLTERDLEIELLRNTAASYEVQLTELENAKASLERRVEEEAEQMLQGQVDQQDELDNARAALIEQHNNIAVIEAKAKEADQRWQDVLDERDTQLAHAQAGFGQQRQENHDLRQQLQQLRARFVESINSSQLRQRRIAHAVTAAQHNIRAECEGWEADHRSELAALGQHSSSPAAVVPARGHRQSLAAKGHARRRNHDSAIGIATDELEPDPIAV